MKYLRVSVIALAVVLPSCTVFAQEDAEGCKDSRLLTRLPGCKIDYCSHADFDSVEAQTSLTKDPRTTHLEGKVEKLHYTCADKSGLQVRRNAEQALRTAGYTLDFTGYDLPTHYVTAHKGAQWVVLAASEMTGASNYDLVTVLTQEMQQEMTSSAQEWANEIGKSGHASVYGIEFDTGRADIKPESEKVLNDVLGLFQSQPTWNLRIEGHTDSTGTHSGNMTLSQKRADGVVAWLAAKGIPQACMKAIGLGDTQPLADNNTEEGRAKNRRVELVKQ